MTPRITLPWRRLPLGLLLGALLLASAGPARAQDARWSEETRSLMLGTQTVRVIHQGRNGEPAAPYLKPLQPEPDDPEEPAAADPAPPGLRHPIAFQIRNLFPIHSPEMRQGRYETLPRLDIAQVPPLPVCLLGTDPVSREWLSLNRAKLKERQVRCLCIEAPTLDSWLSLKQLAPEIPIMPAAIGDFARIGIDRYPVLIGPGGVEQ